MRVGRGHYEFRFWGLGGFNDVWVEASVKELWSSRKVRELFKLFKRLFPSHPSPENTLLVLMKHVEEPWWLLYWLCRHFEHGGSSELAGLAYFMDMLCYEFGGRGGEIEVLDTVTEKLAISVWVENPAYLPKKLLRALKQAMRESSHG